MIEDYKQFCKNNVYLFLNKKNNEILMKCSKITLKLNFTTC